MTTTQLDQSQDNLAELNQRFVNTDANQLVTWAVNTFVEHLVMTSSFGVQAAVMLHLVTRTAPNIPVIWIDTGFNFPETYQFVAELTERLNLNLKIYQSPMSPARMVALYGRLWEQGQESLDQYNQIRKIKPRDQAFHQLNARAWLTGLRSEQTDFRRSLHKIELFNGVVKIHPILAWSSQNVQDYIKQNNLPYHPLYEQGYPSIGDWHSTAPSDGEMADRRGRFPGLKQECGLHLPQSESENASRESSNL